MNPETEKSEKREPVEVVIGSRGDAGSASCDIRTKTRHKVIDAHWIHSP
jgi:hypothetical protein